MEKLIIVRMNQRTCDCGKPQKLHMPCAHAIIVCKHNNIDYLQYVCLVYTLDYMSSVYKVNFSKWTASNECQLFLRNTFTYNTS